MYFHLLTTILQFLAALSPSLRSLDISYNHLADLDGSSLERLSNLQILRLHHNKISNIQKLGLANIQIIDLSSNQVVKRNLSTGAHSEISPRSRACSLVNLRDSPTFVSSTFRQTVSDPFLETPFRFLPFQQTNWPRQAPSLLVLLPGREIMLVRTLHCNNNSPIGVFPPLKTNRDFAWYY